MGPGKNLEPVASKPGLILRLRRLGKPMPARIRPTTRIPIVAPTRHSRACVGLETASDLVGLTGFEPATT